MLDPETEVKCTVGDLMDFLAMNDGVERWVVAKDILERNGLRPLIEASDD